MTKMIFSGLTAVLILMLNLVPAFAEHNSNPPLLQLKGEVLEVEELKEPLGSAIYTIKDLASGTTFKLLADRYRSLIKIGGETKSAGDILGGSKVTIIYQKLPGQSLPEIVFAKVTNSYA